MVYYWHSIVTVDLSCIISEIKRHIGPKSRFFHTSALDAAVRGSPSECSHKVWCEKKTRMVRLPDSETVKKVCHFDRILERDRLTDGRTDRQTPHDGTTANMHSIAQPKET